MRKQFLVYVAVGVLTALIDIGAMQVLLWMSVDHRIAVTVGFILGLIVNYYLHEKFTFKARRTRSFATMLRFGALVLMNYVITMACVQLSVLLFNDVLVGKLVSLPLVAVNGFLWGRYWVFR